MGRRRNDLVDFGDLKTMATQNVALVRDNSTLANFKSWASAISAWFTTAGWSQSSDTGQVNWSTIASVPAVNTYVYEIWQPNDGLTNFYLKVEYGTLAGSTNTCPAIRTSFATSTNGAGTLTGTVTTATANSSLTVTSTVTQWQCYMCGRAGQIQIMMWRDDSTNNGENYFAIERSINSSGSYTSTYATLLQCSAQTFANKTGQHTILFGSGIAPELNPSINNAAVGWSTLFFSGQQGGSCAFSANVPIGPVFPMVGYFDNPMIGTATASAGDITEATTYTPAAANMPYGVSHSYIASKAGPFSVTVNGNSGWGSLLMRYD